MPVSGVTANYNLSSANFASLRHRRCEDFKAMQADVQSGDLGVAQKALSAWQQDNQNIKAQVSSTRQDGSSAHSDRLKSDRDALVSAVQSGDLSGAQKALGTLEQDRQSLRSTSAGESPATFSGDLHLDVNTPSARRRRAAIYGDSAQAAQASFLHSGTH